MLSTIFADMRTAMLGKFLEKNVFTDAFTPTFTHRCGFSPAPFVDIDLDTHRFGILH